MQDETNTTEETLTVDEAFENLPEEVQDFLASDLFSTIIDIIAKTLSLSEEQKNWVRYVSYERLMNTLTDEDAFIFLKNKGLAEDVAVKILYGIDTEILTRAANITEFYTDDVPVIPEDGKDDTIPSSLSTLSDRLKQATIAIPSKRDTTLTRDSSASAPSPSTGSGSPTIDPYHEAIDNE